MEDNKELNTNTENNTDQVLPSSPKVITPIHPDVKPEAEDNPALTPQPATVAPAAQVEPPAPAAAAVPQPTSVAAPAPVKTPDSTSISTFERYPGTSVTSDEEDKSNLIKRWTGRTRAYLAEYAVQLIVLGALITLVNSFFAGIMDSFGEASSGWLSSWMYQISIGQLAAVVAIIPLLILLSLRTGGTEQDAPVVKESNWRKAFLGIFLIITGLVAVGYAIGFVFVIVSMIMNAGLAVDAETSPAITLVKNGFGFVLFGVSALLYARDYRHSIYSSSLWRTIHRYGLIVLAVVLAGVFIALPLQKQRGSYVDSLVVGDLQSITSKITAYAYKERKLPANLDALDLNKEVAARVKSQKYEYKPAGSGGSYELCATFKTDASDNDDGYDFTSAFSGASARESMTADEPVESPSQHKKGYQCFKEKAAGVRSTSTSPSTRLPSSSTRFNSTYDDYDYEDSELFN